MNLTLTRIMKMYALWKMLFIMIFFSLACVSQKSIEDRVTVAKRFAKQRTKAQGPLRRLIGKAAYNVYTNYGPNEIANGIGIVGYAWRDTQGDDDGILLRWCAGNPRLTEIIFEGPNGSYVQSIGDNMQKWHLEDAETTVEYEISFAPTNSFHYNVNAAWLMTAAMREWLILNTNDCRVIFVQKSGYHIEPIPLEDGAKAWRDEKDAEGD